MVTAGQRARLTRVFTQQDFNRFAALSGDKNPIHVDLDFAASSRFGRTVAHGMFLYGVVSAALSQQWPQLGCRQRAQQLKFPAPTFAGEPVDIRLEVAATLAEGSLVEISAELVHQDGRRGLVGTSLVQLGRVSTAPAAVEAAAETASAPAFKGMSIGQRAALRRRFTPADLAEYVDLAGDRCLLLVDRQAAHAAGFLDTPVAGPLLAGLFSTLLGTRLPGPGTNYLKQQLEFRAPAYAGQELLAEVEVVRIRADRQLVNLATRCTSVDGLLVCSGEALVLVSDVA